VAEACVLKETCIESGRFVYATDTEPSPLLWCLESCENSLDLVDGLVSSLDELRGECISAGGGEIIIDPIDGVVDEDDDEDSDEVTWEDHRWWEFWKYYHLKNLWSYTWFKVVLILLVLAIIVTIILQYTYKKDKNKPPRQPVDS